MIVTCNECGYTVEVTGDTARLAHFKGAFPCFQCERGSLVYLRMAEKSLIAQEELSAAQFHLAVTGVGTPEERVAPETILEMLDGEEIRVQSYDVSKGPRPRLTIKSFVTKNSGLEVFLGPSPKGAVVYKVKRWTG